MSQQKNVQWLYEELPGLVGNGVIPVETAEKLRQHYGEPERGGCHWAVILFGILGGALISAGIILLLAHNWDEMSRPVRTVISFLPLLIAQALAAGVLKKWPGSTAAREGVGTFWTVAIGATIALVAQTYQISGDFGAFMLTWSLAALAVVYVLESSMAAMLFWVGVTTWAGDAAWRQGTTVGWFWPVAALAVPHLWRVARANRYRPQVGLMLWVLAGCAAFGIGFGLERDEQRMWIPVFTSYFAVLYLVGELGFAEGRAFWQRPLQTIGGLGVLGLGIALTFADAWDPFLRRADWLALVASPMIVWPVVAVGLWAWMWTRRNVVALLFGGLPVLALIGAALGKVGVATLILMNVYVFGLGVALIALGVRERRLGVMNLGMLVTSALIIARFFDSQMGFVVRGLAFIAVGVGFLVTNMVIIRKTRGAK